MTLNWYDRMGDWNEESLAALRHSLDGTELEGYPGTTLVQALDMLDGVGGFTYTSTLDCQDVYSEFTLDTIQSTLAEGKPILIAWNDWGGHWQVIIGYDTLGTETTQDDVIIVADPYDTTDHNQDGYGIYPAERFYYNFTMYNQFPQEEGGNDMLFVIPPPLPEPGKNTLKTVRAPALNWGRSSLYLSDAGSSSSASTCRAVWTSRRPSSMLRFWSRWWASSSVRPLFSIRARLARLMSRCSAELRLLRAKRSIRWLN